MNKQSSRALGRPRKSTSEITTSEKILHLATELFLSKGYTNVSMDDIAQYGHVTRATIYYYYKTKNDLFTEAMVSLMTRIKNNIYQILSKEEPLRFRLFKLAKTYLQATVDIDINTFMKDAKISLSQEQLLQVEAAEDEMYTVLETALQAEINKGKISANNPRLLAMSFIALLTAGKNYDRGKDLDPFIDEILDLYFYGISHNL